MPNWVTTQMTFSSSNESDVVSLLNVMRDTYGLKSLNSLAEFNDDKFAYPLSSVIGKMPQTFKDYDTTNYTSQGLKERKQRGEEFLTPGFNEAKIELTDEYISNFEKAETEQMEKYGVKGWYDYNCKYLGTKWDSEMRDGAETFNNGVTFYFDTAWTPAEPVFERLVEIIKEKDLDIEMEVKVREEGDSFMGIYCNMCNELSYQEMDYSDDDDFFANWNEDEENE